MKEHTRRVNDCIFRWRFIFIVISNDYERLWGSDNSRIGCCPTTMTLKTQETTKTVRNQSETYISSRIWIKWDRKFCPVGDGILFGVGGSSGLDSRLGASGDWVTVDQDSDENGINVGNPDDVVGSVVVGTSAVGVIVSKEDLEAPPTLASPEFEPGFRFKFEFELGVHVASTLVGGAVAPNVNNSVAPLKDYQLSEFNISYVEMQLVTCSIAIILVFAFKFPL
ncbi:hypothetical protein GCK72_012895 [Caenorhabditis remanei]|uniref:Uncharacterized protein n=1 Tax=Caenorhabditis remanei TaxID=31234 RepID=A0A6A5GPY9_CAERE|nr:hypothetical protein GCK72_012895 [Caenorhabditis remanei]KAF1756442.1 hypothetical protein GCK72_012895 [Caenorhabditis remanei]